ncbi:CopD family protein [Massilia sp. R2A-15]|uniref:copper resistance D family protein n=1 Tax=Massilia sp. R2A-15 TaxID=3064278 RepID=UPI002732A953|nr:CopD family protein [Massilia sp. R2A-15]WLI89881.1 CopD family protein [Massilia sp. R2A-15]
MGAQLAATVMLNLAAAIAVGATLLTLFFSRDSSEWSAIRLPTTRAIALGATIAALLASALLLWLEAALMAETSLAEAGAAVYSMLTQTHYGFAWKIGAVALTAAVLVLGSGPADLTPFFSRGGLLALAVFLYSRSMVSHAAGDGDISIAIAVDWIHLMAISAWSGEVIVAGLATLSNSGSHDKQSVARHVQALSSSATEALAAVVATGAYSAWHNLGSAANVMGSPYGVTLLVKLSCVVVAVGLGAFNRFFVMPSVLAGASARRFVLVLRVEGVVLMAVLVLAAFLSSTPPPLA